VQLITNFNTFALIYQGWYRPYHFPAYNRKELANESFIQLNTYYLIIYSQLVGDAETRYIMGWANIATLGVMVLFNAILIVKW